MLAQGMEGVGGWVRRHPFRTALYAAVVIGGIWAAVTVLTAGPRTLAWLARCDAVRSCVRSRYGVGYAIGALDAAHEARCGIRVAAREVRIEVGKLQAGVAEAGYCVTAGRVTARGLRSGGIAVGSIAAAVAPAGTTEVEAIRLADAGGPLVEVSAVKAAGIERIEAQRIGVGGGLAFVEDARVAGVALSPREARVERVSASGIRVRVAQEESTAWNFAPLVPRFQAAGNELLDAARSARGVAAAAIARVAGDLRIVFWVLAAAAFLLKLAVTRSPDSWVGRAALAAVPPAMGWLISPLAFWIAVAVSVAVAAVLWGAFYRRAAEFHQRWEPTKVDAIFPPLLALLLMGAEALAKVTVPELPGLPPQFSIGAVRANGIDASAELAGCGRGETAGAAIDRIAVDDVRAASWGTARVEGGVLRSKELGPVGPVGFCAVARPAGQTMPTVDCEAGGGAVRFRAALLADVAGLAATFQAGATGRGLAFGVAGDGGAEGVRLGMIKSLPGSTVRVGSGDATVRLERAVTASAKLREIGFQETGAESAAINVTLPALCRVGASAADGLVQGVSAAAGEYRIAVEQVKFEARRPSLRELDVLATVDGVRGTGAGVDVELPRVVTRLAGSTPAATIPAEFAGALDTRVLRRDGTAAVSFDKPLRLEANLREPAVVLPDQQLSANGWAAVRLAARANRQAASGEIEVGTVRIDAPPADFELKRLSAQAAWAAGGEPLRWGARGEATLRLPKLPGETSLHALERLKLDTAGSIPAPLPSFDAVLADAREIADGAARQWPPKLPERVEFAFTARDAPEGAAAFEVVSGEAAPVRGTAMAKLERLNLPDARWELVEAATRLRLEGRPEIGLHSRLTPRETTARIEALSLQASARLGGGEASVSLRAPWETGDLAKWGVELPAGTRLAGRVERLDARWRGSAIEVGATVGRGFTASFALDRMKFFRQAEVRLTEPLTVSYGSEAKRVSVEAPALELLLNGGAQRARAGAELTALLGSPFESRIADSLSAAATGLRRHGTEAWSLLDRPAGMPDAGGAAWDLRINGRDGVRVLELAPALVAVKAAAELRRVSLGGYGLSGTADTRVSLRERDEAHVEVNVDGPIDLRATWPRQATPLALRYDKPTRLLLADTLRRAPPGSRPETLFDSAFYGNSYAIGFGERLGVYAPVGLLPLWHGDVQGQLQASVAWPGNRTAGVTSYGSFDFRGLQAGAAAPLLEDTLQGSVEFSTRDLAASRRLASLVFTDISRATELDKVSLHFKARGGIAAAADGQRGYLQFASSHRLRVRDQFVAGLLAPFVRMAPAGGPLRYRELDARLDVRNGEIQRGAPLVTLAGVESGGPVPVSIPRLRVHWGSQRRGHEDLPIRLRNLLYLLQTSLPAMREPQ